LFESSFSKFISQSVFDIFEQYVAFESSCFFHFIFQIITQSKVFKSNSGQISSNFLNKSGVLSFFQISISFIERISHSSIHSDIYIIVRPVLLSQFLIDS